MSPIRVLDPKIQNKIAAGEVVERPSSVIKELIENSVDANADEIEVFIEESGMKLMRIVDNGEGIHHTDGPLLFQRHATSKIDDDYDLFQIRSLGFRGEALASIGAVSKVKVETKHREGDPVLIQFEGGTLKEEMPGRERQGTDISISELFYNTPARLKYVKSMRTESGKIIDIVQKMALSQPHISFRLIVDHKERLLTKGNGNLKEVISDIYGINIARQAVKIEASDADFKLSGYAVRPEISRSHRNFIHTSVNNRHIRNFKLSQSVINAYHTLLAKDKYPIVIINVEMDPKLVDVNVHPSKVEVRFSKERELNTLVEQSIRNTLRNEMLIPDVSTGNSAPVDKTEQPAMDFSGAKKDALTEQIKRPESVEESDITRKTSLPYQTETKGVYGPDRNTAKQLQDDVAEFKGPEQSSSGSRDIKAMIDEPLEDSRSVKEKLPYLEIIGQLHGTYIIMQNESGMYMMDQHAAQERIKYEFYYDHINTEQDEGVPLLIPYNFEFPLDDIITIDEKLRDLRALGFEIDKTGIKQYSVTRHPSWIKEKNPEADIEDLIQFIARADNFSASKYREEMSIMMSCKQSIKANHYLDKAHMEALLSELRKCDSPYTCPHGRPVIIHMTTYEIERMFNRIMK
ncbi:DNA mismatch repair endonuclease MutL [Salinicoccus albus]|uniref:DNA mismatch repair endonuclease MutL n=1 Tax=Salinicoccus albus TaxID=418756 RepID=UPI00036D27AE|nr:DNA mismatch repair endonuclease MutL [Salinicoccus albus]